MKRSNLVFTVCKTWQENKAILFDRLFIDLKTTENNIFKVPLCFLIILRKMTKVHEWTIITWATLSLNTVHSFTFVKYEQQAMVNN